MKFVVIKDDFYPEDVPFLKDKLSARPGDTIIYEAPEDLRPKLKVLEEAGFIKQVAESVNDIESVDDLIRLTERVQIMEGGTLLLKVFLCGHELEFTESQLLTSITLKKRLLRLGKVISIGGKEWKELLQYWLDIAERVDEVNEDIEMREKVLEYLRRCRIYTDKTRTLTLGTLYYDEQANSVYTLSENVKKLLGKDISLRRIRWLLEDYISGASMQMRVLNERKRYWKLDVEKCGIDLEKQLFREEEKSVVEELETIEEGGVDENGEEDSED